MLGTHTEGLLSLRGGCRRDTRGESGQGERKTETEKKGRRKENKGQTDREKNNKAKTESNLGVSQNKGDSVGRSEVVSEMEEGARS